MNTDQWIYKRKRGSASLVEIVERVEAKEFEKLYPITSPEKDFYDKYDPMNPDHARWFKNFSRQTLYPSSYKDVIDDKTDYFIENPFNIYVTERHKVYTTNIIYLLSVKFTMNLFNIPMPI
jgi:hypothetical protein